MTNGLLTGALRAQFFSNYGRFCRRSRPARSVFPFLRHAPGRAKWWWVRARHHGGRGGQEEEPCMALLALLVAVPLAERAVPRSEEHTSELQSHHDLVCRLLLEKKKNTTNTKRLATLQ